VILAGLPSVMLRGWIPEILPWAQSGVHAFVDLLILYQWFKYALYDDWSARRGLLLQQRKFPWGAFLSLGFVAFWALHFLLSYALLSTSGAQVASVPLKEIVLAVAFGGFMLYLPAKVVGLPWGPLDAFRHAAGLRVRLIFTTVLWAILSLALSRGVDALAWYFAAKAYPAGPSVRAIVAVDFVSGVIGIATDFLAYYVLAYVVAKLFVARTGWTPEPLPG
jgi:hypothetical protein